MVEIKLPEFFGVEEGRNSPIRLGEYVVADGLDRKGKAQVRIQSHIHSDHLNNWKHHIKPGKKLILTGPSKEILMIDESHIKRRATILTPEYDSEIKLPLENNDIKIRVLDAKHIPGSIQCSVEYQNGDLFGYSGDVGEDVDKIIQAEYLIMDTAYTKFKQGSNRTWDREKAFKELLEIIEERVHIGPIHIYARTGMLQEVTQYIERFSEIDFIYIASKKIIELNELFKKWGKTLPDNIEDLSSFQAENVSNLIYLRSYESKGNETLVSTVIDVTNFSAPNESPVKTLSSTEELLNIQVCISNHVYGDSLKDYIKATNAKYIITDSSRSSKKNASDLARDIKQHLNIPAKAAHEIDYWKSSEQGIYD